MSKKSTFTNKLTAKVIVDASNGDVDAMRIIFKNYEGYILFLSKDRLIDEYGNSFTFIDETLRCDLETLLIERTVGFTTKVTELIE